MNSKFSDIFKNIKLSDIISGANKTINVTKKAIPVYKEIRPFFDGKKKLFKKNDEVLNDVDSRPISLKETNDTRGNYNDNLTFFQ